MNGLHEPNKLGAVLHQQVLACLPGESNERRETKHRVHVIPQPGLGLLICQGRARGRVKTQSVCGAVATRRDQPPGYPEPIFLEMSIPRRSSKSQFSSCVSRVTLAQIEAALQPTDRAINQSSAMQTRHSSSSLSVDTPDDWEQAVRLLRDGEFDSGESSIEALFVLVLFADSIHITLHSRCGTRKHLFDEQQADGGHTSRTRTPLSSAL